MDDRTVITGDSTANLTESNVPLTTGGTLVANDPDSSNAFVIRNNAPGNAGYGYFNIAADGQWSYQTNSAHDEFVGGVTYTDQITVATVDGTPQLLSVSILGTDDGTVITGTSRVDLAETNAPLTAGGTLVAADPDSSNGFVAQSNVPGSGGFGSFRIGTDGQWSYAENGAHDEMAGGVTYTDSMTVATADGTQQVISVAIAGSNDAPVISGVPLAAQAVTLGLASQLAQYCNVSDPDSSNLTVTLSAIHGSINGLTDADANSAGIQLTGSAAQINAELQHATFTGTALGAASIGINVTDGGLLSSSASYNLLVSAAGGADVNGDGTPDISQPTLVNSANFLETPSVSNPGGGTNSTVVTLVAASIAGAADPTSGTNLTSIQQVDATTHPSVISMPLGGLSFGATVTQGAAESFSIFVDRSVGANGYWAQNSAGNWVNLATKIETVGDKTRIDFTIQDGGAFDSDHAANGAITETGAIGNMKLSIVGETPVIAPIKGNWF
jgi:VCBS repeat-containing protein